MTTHRRLASVLLFCLLIGGVSAVVAVGAVGETAETGSWSTEAETQNAVLEETEITADVTQLRASLHDDGDADWELRYRQSLDSESDRDAFDDLQADIEADPDAYLDPFEERMQQLVESAELTTEREMEIRNLSIETERVQQPQGEFGIVTFRFEWDGFAVESDGTIEAGDAIDQLILQDDEQLVITWPNEYELESVTPGPTVEDDTQVRWEGPREFSAGQPRVTVSETDAAYGDTTADETTDDEPVGEDGFGSPLLAGLALLVAIIGLLALAWYRRNGAVPQDSDEPDSSAVQSAGAEPTEAEQTAAAEEAELLSSEEQVLRLVEEHGGRVKQQLVTEELDWSAARTSQVVGKLRDQEKIESFRLGRENVLTLPEQSLAEPPESEDEN